MAKLSQQADSLLWEKSKASGDAGCVEVAREGETVVVRDSGRRLRRPVRRLAQHPQHREPQPVKFCWVAVSTVSPTGACRASSLVMAS
jgi:hypothetical protein